MRVDTLALSQFRQFESEQWSFSETTNLIVGANASGKTSLLEAIFFLGRGRSFRTANHSELIRQKENTCVIRAEGLDSRDALMKMGIELQGRSWRARNNKVDIKTRNQLASLLAVSVIDPDVHELIRGIPERRRQFIDWGCFSIYPEYTPVWSVYRKALRQRAAALRNQVALSELEVWDQQLVGAGNTLSDFRRQYLSEFSAIASNMLDDLLGLKVQIVLNPGWPKGNTLERALAERRQRDRDMGYTSVGPHRAELSIKTQGVVAKKWTSRGQEKLLASLLLVAQLKQINAFTGQQALLLVDDLAAELDEENLARLTSAIAGLDSQLFFTALTEKALNLADAKVISLSS